ncbi:MAG: hypothetical protein BWY20_02345 [Spirochaetes bacterium ADurb.Bin215]|nr:MAG: hypothetical protein BWY20_02345 [Spirochaetes bacterium ADurb.Bin215]
MPGGNSVGLFHLGQCCPVKVSPTVKGPVEGFGGVFDDESYIVFGKPGSLFFNEGAQVFRKRQGKFFSLFCDMGIVYTFLNFSYKGIICIASIQQFNDTHFKLKTQGGKPDCMEVALDELPVGKIKVWRLYYTMNHLVHVMKEPLVVGAHG